MSQPEEQTLHMVPTSCVAAGDPPSQLLCPPGLLHPTAAVELGGRTSGCPDLLQPRCHLRP